MLSVSTVAVQKLKEVLAQEGAEGACVRILVVPAGHGFQHMLALEQEAGQEDVVVEVDGLRILVDPDSAPLLEGASIDYLEDEERSGFTIFNPNLPVGGCACGGACDCGGH